MLSNQEKPVTIYSVSGILGKLFAKAFTKCSIEKVFNVTDSSPKLKCF
jgi:hypothetical protein